jgi:hypothetical protein
MFRSGKAAVLLNTFNFETALLRRTVLAGVH